MRQQNLQKFPKTPEFPLKFNRNDQAQINLEFTVPTDGRYQCLMQSFLIHDPDYLPTFSWRYSFVNFAYGSHTDVIVTPEIIRTEGLEHLNPSQRECYFDGEKSLKFFRKYSQRNCEVECIANITMDRCGCVDLTHPFQYSDHLCLNISRVVGYCFLHLQHDLYEYEDFSPERNCSCLPLCNSISYNIKYYTKHESGGNETTINVRMNMDDIVLFRRYQQFTFSDVVSYVGGLLGLFAGISMLSIVEFFYFFTIRLAVDLWRILRGADMF
jgi:amiloride-sensitive sodium channel